MNCVDISQAPFYIAPNTGADLTVAFAAAVAALNPDCSKLIIPPGNYLASEIKIANKAYLTVEAWQAKLIQTKFTNPADYKPFFTAGDGLNYMPDFKLLGAQINGSLNMDLVAGSGIDGLTLDCLENPQVVDCRIGYFPRHGVRSTGKFINGAPHVSAYTAVRGCYVTTCGAHCIFADGSTYSMEINGGVISGSGRTQYGAGFYAQGNDTHRVFGVVFDENQTDIDIQYCSWCSIGPNVHENTKRTAIRLIGGFGHRVAIGTMTNPCQNLPNLSQPAIQISAAGCLVGDGSIGCSAVQPSYTIEELPGANANSYDRLSVTGGGGMIKLAGPKSKIGPSIIWY